MSPNAAGIPIATEKGTRAKIHLSCGSKSSAVRKGQRLSPAWPCSVGGTFG